MPRKRRLVLTNLNPSVFKPRFCKTFLPELIVNALLYDEVLIREGDLIGNRKLRKHLWDAPNFSNLRIFSELLSVGAVKILRQPQSSFSSNVTRSPRKFPVSARAEDQMLNRSDAGRPWKPKDWEWTFFSKLDDVVRGSSLSHKYQKPFPKENRFSTELLVLLANYEHFNLQEKSNFKGIFTDPTMADEFIEFCSDPEASCRFLRNNGVKNPLGQGQGFYRTQAYQCAECFQPNKEARDAMQRLIESTYAACECHREKKAQGRYGRSALAELPARCDNYDEAYKFVKNLEVVPVDSVDSVLKLAVTPGIGDVLAKVRGTQAFDDLQKCLWAIGSQRSPKGEYTDPKVRFTDAWSAVCSEYQDSWGRHISRQDKLDERFGYVGKAVYVGVDTLGFFTCGFPTDVYNLKFDVSLLPVAGLVLAPKIAHFSARLSRSVRALAKMPTAREEMVQAATLRCSSVELNAEPE